MTYHGAMQSLRSDLFRRLTEPGFAFVSGNDMNDELGRILEQPAWDEFAASWNDLAVDAYLAEAGAYRRRRHAVFDLTRAGDVTHQPHQPHFQSKTYNRLQGGIERWFEPITPAVACSHVLDGVLRFCASIFSAQAPGVPRWRTEVHQFRIEAGPNRAGAPTPEGTHRDGVDYVLVLMVCRRNIVSGRTSIHATDGEQLGSFTLTAPLDAALIDDRRVLHGVTPVLAEDSLKPAYRDVLVITLKAEGHGASTTGNATGASS